MATCILLLTLYAFAIPSFSILLYAPHADGSATYDAECNLFVIKKVDVSKETEKSTSTKVADNCCINHHCCSAKVAFSNMNEATIVAVIAVELPFLADQIASGKFVHGFDRPPKSLV